MISVIIPVYNQADSIRRTIAYLYENAFYKRLLKEVIVVDGGSIDRTVEEAEKTGATIVMCPSRDRVTQLNAGARQATGKILYFLQAYSLPPKDFISEIVKAHTRGYGCGSFTVSFSYKHWLLKLLSWITRENDGVHVSDQSLFVSSDLFEKAGGFRAGHCIMANHELINRLKRYTDFIVIHDDVTSSAGKYLRHGILRTELIHALTFFMSRLGYSQEKITERYRTWLGNKAGVQKTKRSIRLDLNISNATEAKALS